MHIPYDHLLFLTLDGVLRRGAIGVFHKMPLLDSFLATHPGVGVVLSPDWREPDDLSRSKAYFSDPMTARRVIDRVTAPPMTRHGARQRGIEQWVRQHQFTGRLTVLDTRADLFDAGWAPLYLVLGRDGLSKDDIAALSARVAPSKGPRQSTRWFGR